ncbi:MAG: hypothetical protein HRT55_00215 [Colwellia sp.]|uniref:hypothetical protein n=1 Tax=Colwellia sp. TaxID=56799 RepID=UPI0025C5E840|nr:hypothetical protein [Colwellia sp.]NQZ24724.1 hypothetical protein [Colwellia sp.]
MNKTTLLTAALIAGIVVAFSYSFLGDDVDSAKTQQRPSQEKAEVLQVKEQPASLSNETKPVTLASDTKSEQKTPLVDENSYVRNAPPPPISSNKSKDGRYTTPQAHGHEEVANNQKKNAPPPPTGAN